MFVKIHTLGPKLSLPSSENRLKLHRYLLIIPYPVAEKKQFLLGLIIFKFLTLSYVHYTMCTIKNIQYNHYYLYSSDAVWQWTKWSPLIDTFTSSKFSNWNYSFYTNLFRYCILFVLSCHNSLLYTYNMIWFGKTNIRVRYKN